jgi:hypothetical protein
LSALSWPLYTSGREISRNKSINNGDFKIIEDKVYDKWYLTETDGQNTYYVSSKIYGELLVKKELYDKAQKNDSVYLLFYKNNKSIEKYNRKINEFKRNCKIIAQSYLATEYELDAELISHLISYNEALGEENFNNRIADKINEFKESGKIIKCKNCNKIYNVKKHTLCPKCDTAYKFSIRDAIHIKEWY